MYHSINNVNATSIHAISNHPAHTINTQNFQLLVHSLISMILWRQFLLYNFNRTILFILPSIITHRPRRPSKYFPSTDAFMSVDSLQCISALSSLETASPCDAMTFWRFCVHGFYGSVFSGSNREFRQPVFCRYNKSQFCHFMQFVLKWCCALANEK